MADPAFMPLIVGDTMGIDNYGAKSSDLTTHQRSSVSFEAPRLKSELSYRSSLMMRGRRREVCRAETG